MNIKQKKSLKYLLISGSIIAGIIALALIIPAQNRASSSHQKEVTAVNVPTLAGKNSKKIGSIKDKNIEHKNPMNKNQLELANKLDKLESKMAKLKANQNELVNMDSDENILMDSPELQEEEIELQTQAQINVMQNTLEAEPMDKDWSDSAVTSLYDAIQSDSSAALAIVDAECRSTLCRVNLALQVDILKMD